MSRYEIQSTVTEGPHEGKWKIAYGFDHPTQSYFISGEIVERHGTRAEYALPYWETGGKSVILDSPFWSDIESTNIDHATSIALDLPF